MQSEGQSQRTELHDGMWIYGLRSEPCPLMFYTTLVRLQGSSCHSVNPGVIWYALVFNYGSYVVNHRATPLVRKYCSGDITSKLFPINP